MGEVHNCWRTQLKIRAVCPDPEALLASLTMADTAVYDVFRESGLCLTFRIDSCTWPVFKAVADRMGCSCSVLQMSGLIHSLSRALSRRVLILGVILLLLLSVFSTGRIFFVRVEGNDHVPASQILNAAEMYGLSFGTRSKSIRSEQLKNQILKQIDSLEWIGVNTSGCIATIRVRERKQTMEQSDLPVGNIVAVADGIVSRTNVIAGMLLCNVGDAVTRGQVLISGLQDLGICTRAIAAEGEIYGITKRELRSRLPAEQMKVIRSGTPREKYSLIFGKKRINLSLGSGILMPGCGKMTERKTLQLFGKIQLPISLIVERYQPVVCMPQNRNPSEARDLLEEACSRYLDQIMICGEILNRAAVEMNAEDLMTLRIVYDCTELIGVRRAVSQLEGAAYDNGQGGER